MYQLMKVVIVRQCRVRPSEGETCASSKRLLSGKRVRPAMPPPARRVVAVQLYFVLKFLHYFLERQVANILIHVRIKRYWTSTIFLYPVN